MKLIDAYVAQASHFMPAEERQDLIDELRGTLEEQVADHAAAAGREPEEADELAVLGGMGHPIRVGSAYASQQYLIGPALFPMYRLVLRWVLAIVIALQIVVAFVSAPQTVSFTGIFFHLLEVAWWTLVAVTLTFAVLEYSGEQLNFFDRWQPQSLRGHAAVGVDYGNQMTNIISEGVLLLWWNGGLSFPYFFQVTLAPVWESLFWPVNLIAGAFLVLHLIVVLTGRWTRPRLIVELVLGIAALAILVTLIMADPLIAHVPLKIDTAIPVQGIVKFALFNIAAFVLWDAWKCLRALFATDRA